MAEVIELFPRPDTVQIEIEAPDGVLSAITTPDAEFYIETTEDMALIVDKDSDEVMYQISMGEMSMMMMYWLTMCAPELLGIDTNAH
jgi:hypothetical protein